MTTNLLGTYCRIIILTDRAMGPIGLKSFCQFLRHMLLSKIPTMSSVTTRSPLCSHLYYKDGLWLSPPHSWLRSPGPQTPPLSISV